MAKVGEGRARELLQEDEEEDFLDEATVSFHRRPHRNRHHHL